VVAVAVGKLAANVQGLAFGGGIINVAPGPLPIYKLMLNYDSYFEFDSTAGLNVDLW
jgi:hypothetical protein